MQIVTQILLLLIIMTALSGCDDRMNPQEWIETSAQLRVTVKNHADHTPYRIEQHRAFKAYFKEIGKMALDAKKNDKTAQELNVVLEQGDLQKVCGKALLPRLEWEQIVKSCTRNRFFLCAEEVRAYPQMVEVLHSRLEPALRKKFDSTDACRSAL